MSSVCLGITTYNKNEALWSTLNQAVHGDLGQIEEVHIADGFKLTAREVYEEFNSKTLPFKLFYTGEEEGNFPIWANKNNNIQYFLESSKSDFLILCDDDNEYIKYSLPFGKATIIEAMLEAHEKTKIHHIMAYLDDYNDPGTNKGFFETFRPHSANEYILRCGGTQGIFMFYSRLAIKTVGYFDKMPERYGAEHALHSARINRLSGRCPEDYVFLKNCHRYIRVKGIPNNYEISQKQIQINMNYYEKRMKEIYSGVDLCILNKPKG